MEQTLASCLSASPITVPLHAASDLVFFISLSAVAVAIILYLRSKQPEFSTMGYVIAGLIFWLGLLSLASFFSLWYPIHMAMSIAKGVTACIMLVTAIAMFPLLPKILEILTPYEYEMIIQQLYDANKQMKANVSHKTEESRKLAYELSNRVRNVLATVHGISKETARSATNVQSYLDRFHSRMVALSHANELLLNNHWKGAPLKDVVYSQLSAFEELNAGTIITGPDMFVNPNTVQNIALALHELASNNAAHTNGSAKKCSITWQTPTHENEDHDNDTLRFVWEEPRTEGRGNGTNKQEYRGFGHSILNYVVPTSLNGLAELRIQKTAIKYELEVPLSSVS